MCTIPHYILKLYTALHYTCVLQLCPNSASFRGRSLHSPWRRQQSSLQSISWLSNIRHLKVAAFILFQMLLGLRGHQSPAKRATTTSRRAGLPWRQHRVTLTFVEFVDRPCDVIDLEMCRPKDAAPELKRSLRLGNHVCIVEYLSTIFHTDVFCTHEACMKLNSNQKKPSRSAKQR